MNQADRDNHANQMNPNNDTYWEDRGFEERPDDWAQQKEQRESTERLAERPRK